MSAITVVTPMKTLCGAKVKRMSAILTRWVMLTSKEPFRSANNPPRINTPDNAHRMMMKGFFVRGEGPISSAAAAVMVAGTVPSPLLTSRKPMPSCCPLPKPVPLLFGRSSFDCSKPKPSSTGCAGVLGARSGPSPVRWDSSDGIQPLLDEYRSIQVCSASQVRSPDYGLLPPNRCSAAQWQLMRHSREHSGQACPHHLADGLAVEPAADFGRHGFHDGTHGAHGQHSTVRPQFRNDLIHDRFGFRPGQGFRKVRLDDLCFGDLRLGAVVMTRRRVGGGRVPALGSLLLQQRGDLEIVEFHRGLARLLPRFELSEDIAHGSKGNPVARLHVDDDVAFQLFLQRHGVPRSSLVESVPGQAYSRVRPE